IARLPMLRIGTCEMSRALDREIVRLAGARGEVDLPWVGVDQCCNLATRLLDGLGGDPAIGVARALRIAKGLGEKRQHCLEHPRIDPRRGLIVEINRRSVAYHTYRFLRALMHKNRAHAARAPMETSRRRR